MTSTGIKKALSYALKEFNTGISGDITQQTLTKEIKDIDYKEAAVAGIGGAITAPAISKVSELAIDKLIYKSKLNLGEDKTITSSNDETKSIKNKEFATFKELKNF